jgi:hypothetical protein
LVSGQSRKQVIALCSVNASQSHWQRPQQTAMRSKNFAADCLEICRFYGQILAIIIFE